MTRLAGELQLSLADLLDVLAALDEGVVFSKDGVVADPVAATRVPASVNLEGVLFDEFLGFPADDLPLLAALDTLLEVAEALLDIASEHVVLVDLLAASLNDLV